MYIQYVRTSMNMQTSSNKKKVPPCKRFCASVLSRYASFWGPRKRVKPRPLHFRVSG